MTTKYEVQFHKQVTVNTDPQRRCYNGCNFSEETIWTDWGYVCQYGSKETAEDSVATFQKINPKREYRILERRMS